MRHLFSNKWFGIAVGVLLLGGTARAKTNKLDQLEQKTRPVIAVVQIEGSGSLLTALLEKRLSQNNRFVLVDREHIDEIIKEHHLAGLSNASSVVERVKLGHLLGADLLVLISERTDPKPRCETIICETSRGLRLQISKLLQANDLETYSEEIENRIDDAIQKQTEPFLAICAVPPFVSRDVSTTYEHLQMAYARMLEIVLLQMPGVLVVEMAEARAVAAETSLTRAKVERSLPIYLVGEYRFDTANPQMPQTVKLTARKGEKTIGTRESGTVSPETAVPFLQISARELIEETLRRKVDIEENTLEYQSLTDMANIHFSIGNYEEAAQLAEVSLLLEQRQPLLHQLAMFAYNRCCWQESKPALEALRYHDQVLVHLECFLRQVYVEHPDPGDSIYKLKGAAIFRSMPEASRETIHLSRTEDRAIKKAVYAHHQRARDMYIRVIKAANIHDTLTDDLLNIILTQWLFEHDLYGETLRENLQKRLDVVPLILSPSVKFPLRYIRDLVKFGLLENMKMTQEYTWFLDELSQYDHLAVQAVVEEERRLLSRLYAEKNQPQVSVNQTISSTKNGVYTTLKPPEIDFVPIILEQKDRNTSAKPFEMSGVMSCGKGVDLVWGASGSKEVFLMETKGQLRKIFEADNRHGFGLAVFDGQYAWLPVTGPESRVLAINPMTDEIVQFTSEDGLPVFQFVALASIGVGRLCLSAGFGKQTDRRAFIAVLELSNPRGKEIRIIHEATQQLMPNTPPSIQHLDPRISYVPKFMISSLDETEQSWMVVLGRIMPGSSLYNPSLLIKPDTASVEVIDPHVETDIAPQNVAFKEHAAYWNNGMGLRCLRTDSKNSEVVRVLPGEGRVMFYNGRLHVVGIDWWIVDEGENPFRKLSVKMPSRRVYSFQFFVSSHYGLVFRAEDSLYKNYQVVFLNE